MKHQVIYHNIYGKLVCQVVRKQGLRRSVLYGLPQDGQLGIVRGDSDYYLDRNYEQTYQLC